MATQINSKIDSIDERVRELEIENEESTVAFKSEYSDKEKREINLISLGFLLPETTGKFNTKSSYPKDVATEDIPLLSADPELKARGIANTSLFEFQSLMNGKYTITFTTDSKVERK